MIERHGSTHVKITGQDAVNYKNEVTIQHPSYKSGIF